MPSEGPYIVANPHGFSLTEGADFEPNLIVTV